MSVNIYNKSTDTLKTVAGVAKLDTWTGTQAEFDALDKSTLSDNCYINITDDLAFSGDEYSTNEIVVGRWIDGKPIYRRVLTGSSITSRDMVLLTNADYINEIVSFKGIVYNSSGTQTTLGSYNAGYFSQCYFSKVQNNSIHLASSADMTGIYRIIVEYTKTTD